MFCYFKFLIYLGIVLRIPFIKHYAGTVFELNDPYHYHPIGIWMVES